LIKATEESEIVGLESDEWLEIVLPAQNIEDTEAQNVPPDFSTEVLIVEETIDEPTEDAEPLVIEDEANQVFWLGILGRKIENNPEIFYIGNWTSDFWDRWVGPLWWALSMFFLTTVVLNQCFILTVLEDGSVPPTLEDFQNDILIEVVSDYLLKNIESSFELSLLNYLFTSQMKILGRRC